MRLVNSARARARDVDVYLAARMSPKMLLASRDVRDDAEKRIVQQRLADEETWPARLRYYYAKRIKGHVRRFPL